MHKLLATGLVAAALVATSAGVATAKQLLFSIIGAPKAVMNAVMLPEWTRDVAEVTGGKVTLKILLKPVAPPPRLYDATTQGVTDSAVIMNAFIQRRAPLVQISMLPFLFTDSEAHAVAMWRTQQKFFNKAKPYEYGDVQLLGFFSGMGGQICSLKDPIRSVEYLRTLKLWSLPGGAAKTLSALNIAVVPGPAVRMYPIVSKGTVDGWASLPVMDAYTFNILDVTKSCTLVEGGLGQATFSIMLNKDVWNGLKRAEQEQIMSASGENLARTSRHWQARSIKQRADFAKAGKQLVEAPPEFLAALRRAAQPQHDEWIAMANGKGIDGKAAYDYFVEQARTAHKWRGSMSGSEPGGPGVPDSARTAAQLRRLLGWMVAGVLGFMMVLTVVDVTGRFGFNRPVPGSFEVMEFCLAIVVFSALPLVTWYRRHITVSLFDSLFRGAGYRIQQGLIQGASLLGMGVICWRMWDQGNRLDRTQAITGYLEWPVAPIAYFMSALAGLSALLIVMLLWRAVTGKPYPAWSDGDGELQG